MRIVIFIIIPNRYFRSKVFFAEDIKVDLKRMWQIQRFNVLNRTAIRYKDNVIQRKVKYKISIKFNKLVYIGLFRRLDFFLPVLVHEEKRYEKYYYRQIFEFK